MKQHALAWVIAAILMAGVPAEAQLRDLAGRLGLGKQLSNDKIVSGLKEALSVGTDNAVKSTGRVDGYLLNEAIKVLMPEKLRTLERGLRAVGYGPKVDEFVVSMNRAAEKAAPHAKEIFLKALREMSFEDARKILSGGETAATQYFKLKTSDSLTAAFRPVVEKSMKEVGVTQQYRQLTGLGSNIPFMKTQAFDLDSYVVSKALDGLFHVLGEEERKIRKNPAARVTALLKEVFGS